MSFWATWCPECTFEMPSLEALSNTLPKNQFIILAVSVGEKKNLVRPFVERNNLTFLVLLDHDLKAYQNWPVLGLPTSFLIDRRGKIIYSVVGATEWTHLSKIQALIRVDQG